MRGRRAAESKSVGCEGPGWISPAAAYEWIGGELRALELIALSEGRVLDRGAVMRLSRPLALIASLHDLHQPDEAGRCAACRRRWWSRRCAVWPLLLSHFTGYLASVAGPGVRVVRR